MKQSSRTLTLIAGAIALVTMSAAADAERHVGRSGSGAYTTDSGKTGTYQWSKQRSGGSVSREQSITTSQGNHYTRSSSGTYDPETKTMTRAVTSPRGGTRTGTASVDGDTGNINVTGTGPGGRSGSVQINPD